MAGLLPHGDREGGISRASLLQSTGGAPIVVGEVGDGKIDIYDVGTADRCGSFTVPGMLPA